MCYLYWHIFCRYLVDIQSIRTILRYSYYVEQLYVSQFLFGLHSRIGRQIDSCFLFLVLVRARTSLYNFLSICLIVATLAINKSAQQKDTILLPISDKDFALS